jgi:hypothetical protein
VKQGLCAGVAQLVERCPSKSDVESSSLFTRSNFTEKNMISVVIATMWRYEPFANFLADMVHHHLVGEIIIIDNDSKNRPAHDVFDNPKIKISDFKRNIYVNPAWNIGVLGALYDKVCIANDDVIFDLRVFDRVYDQLTPDVGAIGLSVLPNEMHHVTGEIRIVPFTAGANTFGFAMVMFVHKQNFQLIPKNLQIYFGDNYIFDNSLWRGLRVLLIQEIFYHSPYGVTAEKAVPNHIEFFKREKEVYRDVIIANGRVPAEWCPEHYLPHDTTTIAE